MLSALWRGANGVRKVLHLVLLLVIFLVFFGAMSGAPPLLPQKAALLIQPTGVLVEQLQGDPYERALAELLGESQPQTRVQDIIDALEYARTDDRIKAVHLELSQLAGGGLNKLQRIGDAIDAFQESGKPVIASADFYLQQGYYLAAHADELYMHPEGVLFLQGFGSYQNYFRDAIELLRIDWNIFRVGTHKSAVEPYIRMDMSPEDRDSRSSLIEQLWGMYKEDVVAARNLPEESIAEFVVNLTDRVAAAGGGVAEAARDSNLIDDMLTRGELRAKLIGLAGEDSEDETTYASVAMREYLDSMRLLHGDKPRETNIAIVVAAGEILNGIQPPGTIGGDSTAELLRRARSDESVKAVVLIVDSPGGSKFASEVIASEILALRAAGKPVVASMSSVAASGGYWISAVADRIVANESTITGSIGIFGMIPTFQRSLAAIGVATDGVGTTPWSGEFRPDREMSAPAKELVQMLIEDGYRDFVSKVAAERGMQEDVVDSIGQGQVWTGADAEKNGLVDQLGGFDTAMAVAAELAGLEEGTYGRKTIKPRLTPTQQMLVDLLTTVKRAGIDPSGFVMAPAPVEVFANQLQKLLSRATRFNDPMGVYTHCLCEIE
jgi:protease-4